MFKETYIWMPRSRPDLPDIIRDMPGVVSANVEWIDAFDNPDAVFETFLVAGRAKSHAKNVKGWYSAGHPRGSGKSEAEACMRAAKKAGWESEMPKPYVGTDPWPGIERLPKPLIGFTTGRLHRAMWRWKEYPAESYAEVINLLEDHFRETAYEGVEYHPTYVQVGWKHDTKIEHSKVVDTRKGGTLRQSLGLIRQCAVFCGNDTGLCWASSALEVPTVVVFGPTDPVKCLPPWGARKVSAGLSCQPCQWRGMTRREDRSTCGHECMKELDPEGVASAIIKEFEKCQTAS
jgi:hypothetical protein